MKQIGSSLLLNLVLSACFASAPNLNQALDGSMQYLREHRLEESRYDSAEALEIRFSDQALGAFAALGYLNPPRGYLLLYKLREGQFELSAFKQTPDVVWGTYSLRDGNKDARIESLHLFANTNQTLKVIGASHANGLWQDGYFEIVEITDAGFETVFSAADFWTDQTMFDVNFQYNYLDDDNDGNVDYILQTSQRCEYQINPATHDKKIFDCPSTQVIYKFDGIRFVEQIAP